MHTCCLNFRFNYLSHIGIDSHRFSERNLEWRSFLFRTSNTCSDWRNTRTKSVAKQNTGVYNCVSPWDKKRLDAVIACWSRKERRALQRNSLYYGRKADDEIPWTAAVRRPRLFRTQQAELKLSHSLFFFFACGSGGEGASSPSWVFPGTPKEWSISNFLCSLTRNTV